MRFIYLIISILVFSFCFTSFKKNIFLKLDNISLFRIYPSLLSFNFNNSSTYYNILLKDYFFRSGIYSGKIIDNVNPNSIVFSCLIKDYSSDDIEVIFYFYFLDMNIGFYKCFFLDKQKIQQGVFFID